MKSYACSASQTINRQLIIRSYEGHIYSHLNIKFVETGWVIYTSPKELKLIFSNKLFILVKFINGWEVTEKDFQIK